MIIILCIYIQIETRCMLILRYCVHTVCDRQYFDVHVVHIVLQVSMHLIIMSV